MAAFRNGDCVVTAAVGDCTGSADMRECVRMSVRI